MPMLGGRPDTCANGSLWVFSLSVALVLYGVAKICLKYD